MTQTSTLVTWQTTLRNLEIQYNSRLKSFVEESIGMNDVNFIMQSLYPGPYQVVEKYLPSRGIFGLELQFSNPKDKTMCLLRWG